MQHSAPRHAATRRVSAYPELMDRYGPMMTTPDLAYELGLAVQTVRNRIRTLSIPSVRIGNRRRWRTAEVAAFIDAGGER